MTFRLTPVLMTLLRTLSVLITAFLFAVIPGISATLDADFSSATTVPVTAAGYTATGNNVSLSLGFAPSTGTNLTVIKNTGPTSIDGQFTNLAQGQELSLSYDGITYKFVADYFGGTGNDLVLHWAYRDLAAWGYNYTGQLGDGTTTNRSTPGFVTQNGVLAGKTIISIVAAGSHSLALCSDGTLAAWGYNNHGQLGDGTTTSRSKPVLVSQSGVLAGKTIISIAAGGSHSLALCSDGTLAAWGSSDNGQLGDGSYYTNRVTPVLVTQSGVLAGKTIVSIAAGGNLSLALCSDGTLAAWGYDGITSRVTPVLVTQNGVLAGKTVVSIEAGGSHSLALCSDGTLVGWGGNLYGQLGDGTTTNRNTPVLVTQSGVLAGKTIVSIAAGGNRSLALCSDGTLVSWGSNSYGQLGDGTTTNRNTPVLVTQSGVLAGRTITSIAAGDSHSLALCSDGTLVSWGDNSYGKLGDGTTISRNTPVLVTQSGVLAGRAIGSIAAGLGHTLVLAASPNSCDLSSMTLSAGSLSPSFSPETISYTAVVSNPAITISVSPATNMSTIAINGTVAGSGNVSRTFPLVTGENMIDLLVTAPDGVSAKSYTVMVTRLPSTISTLSALVTEFGNLSPSFSSGNTTYFLKVSNTRASIALSPTASDADATIQINGTAVSSGAASNPVPLKVGDNTISVVVTAQDGVTSTSYTIIVTRAGSSYDSWKNTVFTPTEQEDPAISDMFATPAGDGIANLMKFALGLDPMSNGTGSLPAISSDSGYLTLTYRKNKQAANLAIAVQAGNDLTDESWNTVSEVIAQADEGDHWLVTVRDVVPQSNQTSRFMRLKVIIQPLQILEALYSANGVTKDVRSHVEANIQNDMVTMTVSNVTMGGDPNVGYVKSLYIRYQNSSGQYEATIRENQTLRIPDASHTKIQ